MGRAKGAHEDVPRQWVSVPPRTQTPPRLRPAGAGEVQAQIEGAKNVAEGAARSFLSPPPQPQPVVSPAPASLTGAQRAAPASAPASLTGAQRAAPASPCDTPRRNKICTALPWKTPPTTPRGTTVPAAAIASRTAPLASRPDLDEAFVSALRAAIHSELGDIFLGSQFRQAMRHEVAEAMKEVVLPELEGSLRMGRARKSVGPAEGKVEEEADREELARGGHEQEIYRGGDRSYTLPMADLFEQPDSQKIVAEPSALSFRPEKGLRENLTLFHYRWLRLQEDPRQLNTKIARIADGPWLETFMCVTIMVDIALMIYVSDRELTEAGYDCSWCESSNWVFQTLYTIELVIKLVAHRFWFFINKSWGQNWLDFFLVVSGFAGNLTSSSSGNAARTLRLFRLGKSLRAVKVMTRIRHLNTFVVCLRGSLQPFFWSLVMLASIFMIFSLFFTQLIVGHLQEEGISLSGELEEMFGSVMRSMLTLYKSVTGGDDWTRPYDVISQVGWGGSVIFLLFIAFISLALINIITGIFVDAAMQTLAPDSETVAHQRARQEEAFAQDLERLCILVDHDESGKLTPQQFKDGIHQGRIPTLLALLGLREEHVLKLFEQMSLVNAHDEGQVNIHSFVRACMKLKGPGTHFDLQQVLEELKHMQEVLKIQQDDIVLRLSRIE